MRRLLLALAGLLVAVSAPAGAEVKEATDTGFTVSFVYRVKSDAPQVWTALVTPSRWWSKDHSYSGDAKNFSLDPRAGGCFCERWGANSVEHGRVIFARENQQLRIQGALGPLQSEALSGTMTVVLKPLGAVTGSGSGTEIRVDYIVGGHARFSMKEMAPVVDQVLGQQVKTLAGLFAAAP